MRYLLCGKQSTVCVILNEGDLICISVIYFLLFNNYFKAAPIKMYYIYFGEIL